jgi:dipeptidyl aminopeptidase/acylaminoacyl peptidase
MSLYEEVPSAGNRHRERFLAEFECWLDAQFALAEQRRAAAFDADTTSVEAFVSSLEPLRDRFRSMLGWPLTLPPETNPPAVDAIEVGSDDLGQVERVWIEVFPGLSLYGVLFLPHKDEPRPLVISQHGGLGTPELTAGFFGSENYNDMTRRVLRRGAVVFAPQLFRWHERFGRQVDHVDVDRQMKQLGGSLAAFELYALQRALDGLLLRDEVDAARVGMVGLSYGGFHTLFAAAADARIRVALSSCFFNDRRRYGRGDWGFYGAANSYFDAEIASLVCPRALFLEVALNDELLDFDSARPEALKVAARYAALGLEDRFAYHEHGGKHEFDTADVGLGFLAGHLGL